jgi:hypothetical protein
MVTDNERSVMNKVRPGIIPNYFKEGNLSALMERGGNRFSDFSFCSRFPEMSLQKIRRIGTSEILRKLGNREFWIPEEEN